MSRFSRRGPRNAGARRKTCWPSTWFPSRSRSWTGPANSRCGTATGCNAPIKGSRYSSQICKPASPGCWPSGSEAVCCWCWAAWPTSYGSIGRPAPATSNWCAAGTRSSSSRRAWWMRRRPNGAPSRASCTTKSDNRWAPFWWISAGSRPGVGGGPGVARAGSVPAQRDGGFGGIGGRPRRPAR